jgi:hypothetical protein
MGEGTEEIVFLTTGWVYRCNDGQRWEKIGIDSTVVNTIIIANRKLYAGGNGIFVMDGFTSVSDQASTRPCSIRLVDNYPNPFNSNTTIVYELDESVAVSLDIYDIHGRRIRALFSEIQSSGKHSVSWSGQTDTGIQVSTGIYFYVLRTARRVTARRMLYLK